MSLRVEGGIQPGIYTKRGTYHSKPFFNFLGQPDDNASIDQDAYAIEWTLSFTSSGGGLVVTNAWTITNSGGSVLYYSTSTVAVPNLATNWRKDSDDTAAPITVTYVAWPLMNLYNLKNVCAAYHNKVVGDLTVAGIDLFLVAANNAKKGAEKLHNFELEWVKATLDLDYITGGLFSEAITTPTDTFSGIKEILSVSGDINNCIVPINFTRPKGMPNSYDWSVPRYPTDGQVSCTSGSCPIGLVFRGDSISIYPTQTNAGTLPITIEGYGWLNDYDTDMVADEDADPQDFLLAYGFDFLQWSIIIELNYVFQTFVNRQEGNVGTPTRSRDEAWEDLVDWDSNRVSPHFRDTR